MTLGALHECLRRGLWEGSARPCEALVPHSQRAGGRAAAAEGVSALMSTPTRTGCLHNGHVWLRLSHGEMHGWWKQCEQPRTCSSLSSGSMSIQQTLHCSSAVTAANSSSWACGAARDSRFAADGFFSVALFVRSSSCRLSSRARSSRARRRARSRLSAERDAVLWVMGSCATQARQQFREEWTAGPSRIQNAVTKGTPSKAVLHDHLYDPPGLGAQNSSDLCVAPPLTKPGTERARPRAGWLEPGRR